MADCSYARCIQERRFIKRELLKWTKDMVYIVGLERVAEELMGRRKWKLYQEVLARSTHQNTVNSTNFLQQQEASVDSIMLNKNSINSVNQNNGFQQQTHQQQPEISSQDDEKTLHLSQKILENHLREKDITTIKCETIDIKKEITKQDQEHFTDVDEEINTKDLVKIETNTVDDLKISSGNNNNITTLDDKQEIKGEKTDNVVVVGGGGGEGGGEVTAPKDETPIDWKPQDKCYFCVDGKLLTVNEKGELVAESGPSAQTEADVAIRSPHDSESDSSDSCSESEVRARRTIASVGGVPVTPATVQAAAVNKTLEGLLRGTIPSNMTSLESMAATLQAVATLQGLNSVPGLGSFYNGFLYQQIAQQLPHQSAVAAAAAAAAAASGNNSESHATTSGTPLVKISSSPNVEGGGAPNAEQPLDLSAKSSTPTFPANDPRLMLQNLSRTAGKTRGSTVAGRRTYTEEELQLALQDIISGKLGTRRAAVLYGIPRSTLRNKVYKLAMEKKREEMILKQQVLESQQVDDDDKDMSDGDDEKDVEKVIPLLHHRASPMSLDPKPLAQSSPNMSQHTPHTPPIGGQNSWGDPNLMLQSLLMSSGLGNLPGLMSTKPEELANLPDFIRTLMLQQQELIKNAVAGHQHQQQTSGGGELMNNGKSNVTDARLLLMQQQQLQQQHQQRMHLKSDTPGSASSADVNDLDDSNVILKIPSYKALPGGTSSTPSPSSMASQSGASTKLNNSHESMLSPHLQHHHQQRQTNSSTPTSRNSPLSSSSHMLVGAGLSPPLKRQNSDSQSPPISQLPGKKMMSLHDVIADSISRSFQQQQHSPELIGKHHHDPMEQYKRPPQISVLKNLGGTDLTRFGTSPNLMNSSSLSNSLTGTGGKGTRPKRGKYRNYDRDSLVEAVKAVQRGEMSVHRAGSYYGVPHSTLEYKVKERHLMRPRKREPKPQPTDGTSTSTSSSAAVKPSDISGASGTLRTLDKSKVLPSTKPPLKTPPFPSTSPNGMKMSMFDPMAGHYPSQMFWPHPPGFGMDFGRLSAQGGPSQFPPNAEQFFASQMMQKYQEESTRSQQLQGSATNNNQIKNLVANLYDGNNANGLLDGIIRKTLDRGKNDGSHGALLEQLVNNNRSNSTTSEETTSNNGTKRSGSPLNYGHMMDIKRERSSPMSSSDSDRDSPDLSLNQDAAENLVKLRDGLNLRSLEEQQQQLKQQHHHHHQNNNSSEELNGKSTSLHSDQINNQSDNDDST